MFRDELLALPVHCLILPLKGIEVVLLDLKIVELLLVWLPRSELDAVEVILPNLIYLPYLPSFR